jgi:TrbC/VIRB2 pilin
MRFIQSVRHKALVVAVALVSSVPAFAQTADPFDAAVTAMSGKVTSYGTGLVALALVGVGFMIAIKYVKKLSRAA